MVKISLPNPRDYSGNIKQFIRQLELAVHHIEKSYEQLISDGSIVDGVETDNFITYRHPQMNLDNREQDDKGFVKVHIDEESEEMNDIEIEIN